MPKFSAGLLLYRLKNDEPEILLVHPGGPFWTKKDTGTWSVPKGMVNENEGMFAAALREFTEETGLLAPIDHAVPLGHVTYSSKQVHVWAVESDADVTTITSQVVQLEWPPRSGRTMEFPECDKAAWFNFGTAKIKLVKGQVPFVDRLAKLVG